MAFIEVNETKTRRLKVTPCIKCGCDDINLVNCGYSSFNVAFGECKNCNHRVDVGASWNDGDEVILKGWNHENDPVRTIKELENRKSEIELEIQRIQKLTSKLDPITK